ncbi:L-aminopeptidase/D-esterase-like protein [Parvibaculum indicum]|uniref:P1 family peptidase n=1 Tax=Parvibaculum indicum TaxID=562969 RepID=UPI001424300A|nr:P1 family peptidase [Parvibaculum indicum]NIJ40846.1 L-aminopeptidase/D-esterase-like protein [Parvibaculum indicum]
MAEARITPGPRNLITDVAGLSIGNAQDACARTGVTVLLPDEPGIAAMDVRGGGPGTRESDALDPRHLLEGRVDALVLSGGSVYGLDAPSGVTHWLGRQGRGFAFPGLSVTAPIVPGAILFDLANGGEKYWAAQGAHGVVQEPPYRALGYEACEAAGADFALGNAGAGFGAQAGRYKGGLGSASAVTPDGITVGALVAVNAVGSPVIPGTDCFWAAPFELDGEFGGRRWDGQASPAACDPLEGSKLAAGPRENTTIAIVATDATLDATAMHRIAVMAHDGFARALRPVHAPVDGDAVFALSTGRKPLEAEARTLDITRLGAIAADCTARAIARGVFEAETLGAILSWADRHGGR